MVWMEVRKEDAVYGERIQARAEHAADRSRTEIEDERLPTRAHHDTALAPLEVWNYGAGSYDGDVHCRSLRSLSISVSTSACQAYDVGSAARSRCIGLQPGWHVVCGQLLTVVRLSIAG